MNTIEKLGDDETLRQIVERSIIYFEDNELTEVAKDYSFYSCDKLTDVSLPSATSIGSYAFQAYSALTSVPLPVATSIGNEAFRDCRNLTTMYIGTELDDETAICTLTGTNSFPLSIEAIYILYNLQDKYKASTNWSSFTDKIKAYTGEAA